LVHFAPEPVDEEVALSPWYVFGIGKGQGACGIDLAPSSVEPFCLSPGRWLSDLKLLLLKLLMWLTASLAAH